MSGPSPLPPAERIAALHDFFLRAGALKDTLRSGNTPGGARESTAAHSWELCLLVLLHAPSLGHLDLPRLLRLCILHDLGEAISGDIPATEQRHDKSAEERADFITLCDGLPADIAAEFLALWDEYTAGQTPEARAAKGLDKLTTMLSHVGGQQDPGFDYLWNLGYARRWTDDDPLLSALRTDVDARTRDAGTSDKR